MRAGCRDLLPAAMWLGMVASPAFGAELPRPVLPEAPHLGTCGVAGGGFVLPGTDGCLTLGGFVRAEGAWRLSAPAATLAPLPSRAAPPLAVASDRLDHSALGASARLTADIRLPTDLGPVRVFVSLRGRNGAATDRAAR